ncbi:hypothetical protein T484DRAFT_1784533 [Baffinella frigidus]|nr:hypothetical protein T484DRAFT_1784533 [Cryptophyta sp. CCMP2293]
MTELFFTTERRRLTETRSNKQALTILPGKFVTASELNNIVAIFMPQVELESFTILPGKFVTASELNNIVAIFMPQGMGLFFFLFFFKVVSPFLLFLSSLVELEALTIPPGKFVTASELNNIVAIFMPQVELESFTILPGKFVTASELNNIVAIFMPQVKNREVKNRESEGVRAALKSGMHALTRFSLSLVGMLPVLRLTREMA